MFVYVVALLPALAIAALAHELTHVGAARVLGAESAQIKWFRRRESWVSLTLIVDYDFGQPVGDWRHRIVGFITAALRRGDRSGSLDREWSAILQPGHDRTRRQLGDVHSDGWSGGLPCLKISA